MKHWKKKLGAACLALSLMVPGTATAVVIPKDLPTIEALIALHKCIKKDEDQALGRVATSFGEQSMITKGANKFNEVRTTLNTKMSNAHSYLVLAGAISSTCWSKSTRTLPPTPSSMSRRSPLWDGTMPMPTWR